MTAVPRAFTSPVNHTTFHNERHYRQQRSLRKNTVLWDEMPRSMVGTYRRFGEIDCFLTA